MTTKYGNQQINQAAQYSSKIDTYSALRLCISLSTATPCLSRLLLPRLTELCVGAYFGVNIGVDSASALWYKLIRGRIEEAELPH